MSTPNPDQFNFVALRRILSEARLLPYEDLIGGNLADAFALYEWNMEASAGLLITTGMLEIVVRNAMDAQLVAWASTKGHEDWFEIAPLDPKGRKDVEKARRRTSRRGASDCERGRVVAELSFGFWRYLTTSRRHASLWVPALAAAFPNGAANLTLRRIEVDSRMDRLLFVRNRAAHHEPIHRRDLLRDLDAAIDLARWISPDAANWINAKSPLRSLVQTRPSANT